MYNYQNKRTYIDNLRIHSNFLYKKILVCDVLMKAYVTIVYEPLKVTNLDYISIVKKMFRTFDFSDFSDLFNNYNIVSTLQVNRTDYNDLLCLYIQDVKDCSKPYCFEGQLEKKTFVLSNILAGVYFFIKMIGVVVGFKNHLFVTATFVNYLNQLSSLEKSFKGINFKNKTYIPFNSSFDIENLYTQFFNREKCKTFHISHGLNYIKNNEEQTYDYVNGLCISGNDVLVWGKSSEENLLTNYGESKKIVVAGNPKYPHKQISISQEFTECIVFLARPIFDEYNMKLLQLVGQKNRNCNINFSVKAHPFSNLAKINEICELYKMSLLPNTLTINQLLSSGIYDFSISYNTTAYYESMYYGLLSFRFALGECEKFDGLEDKFSSLKELEENIDKFKKMNSESINDAVTSLLIHNLGMGINKYNKIFSDECI